MTTANQTAIGLVSLCFLGCGGYPPRGADDRAAKPVIQTCFIAGLERVQLEFAVDCLRVEQLYGLARRIMDEKGLVPAESRAFAGTRVLVIDESSILHDGGVWGGWYEARPDEVALTRSGWALLHELLHDWQFKHGISNSGAHPGWVENGYWEAVARFQAAAAPIG